MLHYQNLPPLHVSLPESLPLILSQRKKNPLQQNVVNLKCVCSTWYQVIASIILIQPHEQEEQEILNQVAHHWCYNPVLVGHPHGRLAPGLSLSICSLCIIIIRVCFHWSSKPESLLQTNTSRPRVFIPKLWRNTKDRMLKHSATNSQPFLLPPGVHWEHLNVWKSWNLLTYV